MPPLFTIEKERFCCKFLQSFSPKHIGWYSTEDFFLVDEGGPKTFSLILFMFREHRLIEGAEDFFLCKIYWLIFEWRLFLQRTLDDRRCRRLFLVQNLLVDNRCLNQRQSGVTLCLEMNCRRTMKNHHTCLHQSSSILSEKGWTDTNDTCITSVLLCNHFLVMMKKGWTDTNDTCITSVLLCNHFLVMMNK